MARIVHLSDLHFGAHDPLLVAAVEEQIAADPPDLVVVSGDFTQRARTGQFRAARAFLERLREAGHALLGVPGNHDVPLYDIARRFLSPLTRYRRFIDDELCPFIELPGAAVLGINTARSLTFSGGRIGHRQMERIAAIFADCDPAAARVLVTHHPLFALAVGEGPKLTRPAGRSDLALDSIAEAGVDLLLAGHNHRASAHSARDLVTRAGPALVVQAGTATSIRLRGEQQSFNRLELSRQEVTLTMMCWDGGRFVPREALDYRRDGDHWRAGVEVDPDRQTLVAG